MRQARADRADVVVVGGGPAGATTAWALARNGVEVLVLDRARFPRAKPCAEYLNPLARRILSEMGALDAVIRSGAAPLAGMTIHAPDGRAFQGRFAAAGPGDDGNAGLGIRRELLDPILLERARDAGAHVADGVAVTEVLRGADGRAAGVRVREGNSTRDITARVVVGADGLRSLVGRRLGLVRSSRWPRRMGFVAHYRGVDGIGDCGEMHVTRGGYCGLANVGGGLTNVGLVLSVRTAAGARGDAAGFVERWVASQPALGARFARARRVTPVRATGPFAVHARRAWAPGAVLVGDAAHFFDPFTGEGMFEAMRGGELLGPYVFEALRARSPRVADDALAAYDRSRRHEFGKSWRVQWVVALAVACPPLLNRAARAASGHHALADVVVRVAGGFSTPGALMRPSYLRELLLPTRPR